jgi:UDPglucose 6-dehydrogenase
MPVRFFETIEQMPKPTISIIGLGYVGLSTAICFADRGFNVVGVEIDHPKIEAIKSGKLPFREKGLDQMLHRVLKRRTLTVTSTYHDPIQSSSVTFITVGTPSREDGSIDLKYVESASLEIGSELAKKKGYHLVIEKSTVIPGTTAGKVKSALEERSQKRAGRDFGLCVNPEFLRESSAIHDTLHPDAIVVGSEDNKSKTALVSLYRRFYGKLPPLIATGLANAELIKYAVNTFRTTQLSFLNTLANICSKVPEANAQEVISGLSTITKIDGRYLRPGFGYGGSCLPKDLRALIAHSRELDVNAKLLEAAREINELQPSRAVEMSQALIGDLKGKNVSVLGLAYKAGTDDARESVAIKVLNALKDAGANVIVYDPSATDNAKKIIGDGISYASDARSCIKGADCCIIATEWDEFKRIKPEVFKTLMRYPAVVDGRQIFDPEIFSASGVKYLSIGRYEEI